MSAVQNPGGAAAPEQGKAANAEVKKAQWPLQSRGPSADDPLLKCLVLLTRFFNRPFSEETLCAGLPLIDSRLTPDLFVRAAERAGLTAKVARRPLERISPLVLPVVLLLVNAQACILKAVKADGRCEIVDPDTGGASEIAIDELRKLYAGHAIFVRQQLRFDSRTEHSAVPRIEHWFWGVV
ncbi:MAG TPA: cysteine peptidase family C39 domain-containing protein, partial [Burkholderiales bacterium]|nr:cysteine peptidase family C39 domain-containing protein [Burkholderiales bacterium]